MPVSKLGKLTVNQLLIALIVLHLFVVGLFYLRVIPDPYHTPGTFRFHHGGDEHDYWLLAQSIIDGSPIRSRMTLGYPLMIIPWLLVSQSRDINLVLQPIALLNALLLFPIAEIFLFRFTRQLTGSNTTGILTVLIWVLMPVMVYFVMLIAGRGSLGALWAVHFTWAQMLSEPITTLLTIVSFWLLLKIIGRSSNDSISFESILLGIICGLLLLIRMNTLLSLGSIIGVLIWYRKWKVFITVVICSGLVFSPQLIYNSIFFGNPFYTGYQALTSGPHGLFSVSYLIGAFNKSALIMWISTFLLIVFLGTGLYTLYRQSRLAAVIIGIWVVAYLLFFSVYYYSWVGGLFRFLIPMYPAIALLIATLLRSVFGSSRLMILSQTSLSNPQQEVGSIQ